jgi:hypothetical protein
LAALAFSAPNKSAADFEEDEEGSAKGAAGVANTNSQGIQGVILDFENNLRRISSL